MTKKGRTLIKWVIGVGSFLAAIEGFSLISPGWRFNPYFHYLVYMSLANTFVPLPTNPLIIYMGREFLPLAVSIIGAIGTSVANMTEYLLIGTLLEYKKIRKIRETATYETLKRYFEISPFTLMIAINFLPVPVDPIRWMAISVDYPRWRYILSTFLGRFPRYFILAWIGYRYELSNRTLLILLAVTAVAVLTRKILGSARKRG